MSTFTYEVKVASGKFTIDGGPAPKLTFRDGDTFVFDQADASNSGHILQFSITSNNSGASEYTTGVTKTGTPGNAGAKTTIVTSGSTTDTLYYYSSGGGTHGEEFSNTGFNTTAENLLKPIVGADSTAEKWGPMINQSIDQIVPKSGGTFNGDLTVTGDMTVSGTTTTLDTTLQSVDKLEVGANSSDYGVQINQQGTGYGAQINQSGTGDILRLLDGGNNVLVVEDGGTSKFTGAVWIDYISIDGHAITSRDTNGNIDLTPNGTGEVNISKVDIDAGTIDGVTITSPVINTGVSGTAILDSDTMSGASATTLSTSESIKEYADTKWQDWSEIADGTRIDYDLEFKPPSSWTNSYAGFKFLKESDSSSAGYLLVKNAGDALPYSADSISLVADTGHLNLIQKTSSSHGIKFYTGGTTAERMYIDNSGNIETSTTGKLKQKGAFMQHSTNQAWVMGG